MLEQHRKPREPDAFKDAFARLEKASHKLAEVLYKSAAASSTPGGGDGTGGGGDGASSGDGSGKPGGKGDVIDAEYEEAPKQ